MALNPSKYDGIFLDQAKKHGFSPQMVRIFKGVVMVESSFMPRAYRYEPELFKRMKDKDPYWADKDPSIVAASMGLAQILFTTAWCLGLRPDNWKSLKHHEFQALAERIYDPETNLGYQAQLMRKLIDCIWADHLPERYENLSAMDIALARYNGGSFRNPDESGILRNQKYVDKVWRAVKDLYGKER